MLLAHPAVDGVAPGAARLAAAAALPLALFISYHLVNPQEHARRTFWDARFLALAGAPGQVQSCDGLRHLTLLCRACMMAPLHHSLPLALPLSWLTCGGAQACWGRPARAHTTPQAGRWPLRPSRTGCPSMRGSCCWAGTPKRAAASSLALRPGSAGDRRVRLGQNSLGWDVPTVACLSAHATLRQLGLAYIAGALFSHVFWYMLPGRR